MDIQKLSCEQKDQVISHKIFANCLQIMFKIIYKLSYNYILSVWIYILK